MCLQPGLGPDTSGKKSILAYIFPKTVWVIVNHILHNVNVCKCTNQHVLQNNVKSVLIKVFVTSDMRL